MLSTSKLRVALGKGRERERERERERKTGRTGGHALWWVCALPSADSGESGPDTPIRSFLGVTRADDASVSKKGKKPSRSVSSLEIPSNFSVEVGFSLLPLIRVYCFHH
ncbi:hypothetical protein F2P79_006568 [Pimephales promelas]|nr:hypothetical protein F2P79_006568 [Pimephales promelas]